MGRVVISLAAMFASLAFFTAGTALLTTVLALELANAGFSAGALGLVLVCHSIGFVLGTRFATRVMRRVGSVRSFSAFAAVACAAALIHPMYVDGWLWALLRGLVGFCAAGLIMVLESWISGRATRANRGTLLGIYQVIYFFAAALGQYLVGMGAADDYPIYSLAAILLVLSLVPLALTRSEAPALDAFERLGFVALYRASPSGLFGAVTGGIAVSAFLSLAPVYARTIGFDMADVSRYMAFAVLATMALQWPIGRLSDRYDRRRLVTVLAAICVLGALVIALVDGHWPAVLFATTVLVFGLAGCLYPVSLAMVNDSPRPIDATAASAGLLFVYGVGTCIGPLGGALAMQYVGAMGLFIFLAGIFGVYGALLAWRGVKTPAVPVAQQSPFVAIVAAQAAPAIAELDPRTDMPGEPAEAGVSPASGDADSDPFAS